MRNTDIPGISEEDLANNRRKVEQEGAKTDKGIIGSIEKAVGSFTKPLLAEKPTEADLKERREENDADSRS